MTRPAPAGLPLALLLLGAPALADDGGEAAQAPELRGRISQLELACELPRCRTPEEYARLLSLTDLWEGKEYRREDVDAAQRNLMKTGLFYEVVPVVAQGRLGVSVKLDTVGATVVERVHVHGEGMLLESDVRRRIFFRPGGMLDASDDNLEEQRASLLQWLSRLGYHGSNVRIEIDAEDYLADVTIDLDIGDFNTLRDIQVEGLTALPAWRVRWTYLQPRRFGLSGLYLPQTMKAARDDVLELLNDLGHFEARLRVEPQIDELAGRVDVKVVVREGRRTDLRFDGNDAVADFELVPLLPFAEARAVTADLLRRAEAAIREEYQDRGYHFATVRAEEQPSAGRDAPRVVTFQIYEGPVARIEAIRFEGGRTFSEEELQGAITTLPFALFRGEPGFALDRQLADDAGRLRNWYVERGFLSAEASLDRIEARQDGEYLTVVFRLTEGPRTWLSHVSVAGVTRYSRQDVAQTLGLTHGSPYGPRGVLEACARLLRRYRKDGLPHARVVATCRLPGGEVVSCDADRVAGPYVSLEVDVTEGPRVTVGEILVRGNFRTSESTLLQEFPFSEGEPFDYGALLEGQANLRSLGLFRSVGTTLIGFARGEQRDRVGLSLAVEEREYTFLDFLAGLETQSRSFKDEAGKTQEELLLGVALRTAYLNENLAGWGKQLELPVQLGNLETSFRPTWLDPRFLGTKTRLRVQPSVALRNQVLDPKNPIDLPLEPFGLTDGGGLTESFNVFEVGTKVSFQQEFSKQTLGTLELELERQLRKEKALHFNDAGAWCLSGKPDTLSSESLCPARDTVFRLTPGWRHDRRNSPLHPTRGYQVTSEVTLGSKVAGFASLGDDYFVRLYGAVETYQSFVAERFVVANSLRVGLGFAGGDSSSGRLPFDDRFKLGGGTTVRGLTDAGVTVPGETEVGGNRTALYNLELRARLLWWFWAVAFYDLGTLVDTLDQLTGEAMWHSFGVGVRWLILNQIPLRFDVGFPVELHGAKRSSAHIAIGYPF